MFEDSELTKIIIINAPKLNLLPHIPSLPPSPPQIKTKPKINIIGHISVLGIRKQNEHYNIVALLK